MLKLFATFTTLAYGRNLAVQSPARSFALWDQVKRLAKMDSFAMRVNSVCL